MKRAPHSTHEERLHWVIEHPDLWEAFPQSRREMWDNPVARTKHKRIIRAMKADGLIAASTYYADVNVIGLVNEARRLRRMAQRKRAST